jgi:Ca2+/Na+ antiporter
MNPIAFAQSIWAHYLQLDPGAQLLVFSSSLIILGSPVSILGALKSRELGMRYASRQQFVMTLGLFLTAVGIIIGHFNLRHSGAGVVIELLGIVVLYGSFVFARQARKERIAYRNNTITSEQPLVSASANAWPPAPATGEG